MAYGNNFIEELKARVNIVDVIGREVDLKRAGSNFKGLCPFHNEKTPSFVVSEQKQIFNCFGCHEKGDVIKFVSRYYGLEFMEAVEKLADEYNMELPKRGGKNIDYNKYYEINSLAGKFYYDRLTREANNGYRYIKGRGLADSTITRFGLGYAPARGDALYKYLLSKDVSEEDMLKLGLIIKGKNGYYDKFRDRVMFPIFNAQGKVIGFGGRALGDAMPKYLNSAESDIFLKKNNLYGLNFSKKNVSDDGYILIVEGYMDAISLYQAGVKNVAASLGTALTENQARLISRYTRNVVLSYDADSAGINAAFRGIDILRGAGISVKILRIPDGKDPDEYIKKHGKEEFLKLVKNAMPAIEFKLNILERGYDLGREEDITKYVRACMTVLESLPPVECELYTKKLAERLGISDTALNKQVELSRGDSYNRAVNAPNKYNNSIIKELSDADLKLDFSFIALVAANTEYINDIRNDGIRFRTPLGRKVWSIIGDMIESQGSTISWTAINERLDPDEEQIISSIIRLFEIGNLDYEFYRDCLKTYELALLKDRKVELETELSVAYRNIDEQEIIRINSELQQVNMAIGKVRN